MRVWPLVIVAGCSYSPGSFSFPGRTFAGQQVTVGCLDISLDRRPDFDGKAVINYQFGNRCDEPVVIDLLRVPVTGRTLDGDEVTLTPFDPAMEMMAMKLDARKAGGEAIAYPSTQPLAQVCVDAGAITETNQSRWMCFALHSEIARMAEVSP
jgi:hypothetical protein